jgi:hypothetical protein
MHELDGMEVRFRHSEVHGLFPGALFLSFIEMKDPEPFLHIPINGTESLLKVELDGHDQNLIPVPLGERRKGGSLELLVKDEAHLVERLTIEALISYKTQALGPKDGQHYAYGPLEAPMSALSHFNSEMFGMPVEINRFARRGSKPLATISFPSGVKLPGKLINPFLTDMTKVDIKILHRMPVTMKLHGGKPVDGIFLDLAAGVFGDEVKKLEFDREFFVFLTKKDLDEFVIGVTENPDKEMDWNLMHVLPREAVEFIDLTPSIASNIGKSFSAG